MRINPFLFGVLVLGVFMGVIYGFRSAGVWSISGKVNAQGERIAPSTTDVESIKGWMTIGEIAEAYNIPLAELLAQFQLPAVTPAETAVKDLESETFSVSGLREWLQLRIDSGAQPQPVATQVPVIEPSALEQITPTALPPVTDSSTTTEQPQAQPGAGSGIAGEEHTPPEQRVNARTTFQDLLDWGVSAEAIQQIIGGELPTPGTVVKDYVTSKGEEFSSVKNALQAEVDKLNP